jgi:hypothetical protein
MFHGLTVTNHRGCVGSVERVVHVCVTLRALHLTVKNDFLFWSGSVLAAALQVKLAEIVLVVAFPHFGLILLQ